LKQATLFGAAKTGLTELNNNAKVSESQFLATFGMS